MGSPNCGSVPLFSRQSIRAVCGNSLKLDPLSTFSVIAAKLQIMEALRRHRNTTNKTFKFKIYHLDFLFFGEEVPILTPKNLKTMKTEYRYFMLIRHSGKM